MPRNFVLIVLLTATLTATSMSMGDGILTVQGNPSCVAQCRAAHSQCRIASKGSPSCDGQLQSCLQGCLGRK